MTEPELTSSLDHEPPEVRDDQDAIPGQPDGENAPKPDLHLYGTATYGRATYDTTA